MSAYNSSSLWAPLDFFGQVRKNLDDPQQACYLFTLFIPDMQRIMQKGQNNASSYVASILLSILAENKCTFALHAFGKTFHQPLTANYRRSKVRS